MMAFDTALKTLTDRLAGHINFLAYREDRYANLITRFEASKIRSRNRELSKYVTRLDASLGEMARQGLTDT